jgi:hypothetical protein
MIRRFLLPGAVLLFILSLVPACDGGRKTNTGATPPLPDKAPPPPRPAGKPG